MTSGLSPGREHGVRVLPERHAVDQRIQRDLMPANVDEVVVPSNHARRQSDDRIGEVGALKDRHRTPAARSSGSSSSANACLASTARAPATSTLTSTPATSSDTVIVLTSRGSTASVSSLSGESIQGHRQPVLTGSDDGEGEPARGLSPAGERLAGRARRQRHGAPCAAPSHLRRRRPGRGSRCRFAPMRRRTRDGGRAPAQTHARTTRRERASQLPPTVAWLPTSFPGTPAY